MIRNPAGFPSGQKTLIENAHGPKAHARKMKIDMLQSHDLTIFVRMWVSSCPAEETRLHPQISLAKSLTSA
jgi:hypothetical protein